jgi:hypothetical protein
VTRTPSGRRAGRDRGDFDDREPPLWPVAVIIAGMLVGFVHFAVGFESLVNLFGYWFHAEPFGVGAPGSPR